MLLPLAWGEKFLKVCVEKIGFHKEESLLPGFPFF